MEQIFINKIRNIFYSCSEWTISQQCRGECWSHRNWCCWKTKRVLLVVLFVVQNGDFCWTSHVQVVKRCCWKGSINARSENSVYIDLIIFSVKFNIVHISRHLMPDCVYIFCTYTWKYFVPHFMCSLLVRGNWNSRWMVVQKLLSLGQQQAPSCQKSFWGTFCHFLDKIIYSQSHQIRSKVERPLKIVNRDWENLVALM